MGRWPIARIGDVATVRSGYAFKSADWLDHGIPVVKIANVKEGNLDMSGCSCVSPTTASRSRDCTLAAGDILVAMTGYIGDTAFVRQSDLPALVNQRVGKFAIADESLLDRRFLFYALRSDAVRTAIKSLGYGSAQPNVSPALIHQVTMPLPPLSEQRAIAEVLGALDDKIEANRTKVAVLSELTGATWQDQFGHNASRRWPLLPIGDLASVVGGSTPSTAVSEFWDGNVAWATPTDLSKLPSVPLLDTERRVTEQGLQRISSGLLPVGTVLLSSRAPIGYLAIAEVPLAINQGFIALVAGGRVSNLYLWQWLRVHLDNVKSRANGTTFLEVSKANFRPMLVEVPPQERMRSWTEVAVSLYRLIVATEREAASLADMRDAMLPKLLTGELRLRDAEALAEEAV